MLSAALPGRLEAITLALAAKAGVDRAVWIILIAIAIILAVGLAVAWWLACQAQGGYPALDMPGWSSGGTWKAYCAR